MKPLKIATGCLLVFIQSTHFFPAKLPLDLNEKDIPFMSAAVVSTRMFIFCADSALWILKHKCQMSTCMA